MALTVNHPFTEEDVYIYSSSIGTSPVAGYARAPFRGRITKLTVIQSAAVTGTSTVTGAINGTSITGGAVSVTGGGAGTLFSVVPTGANNVVEDDVISLTPAGATGGAGILGFCTATIRRT